MNIKKVLSDDKESTVTGFGFLNFNCSINLTLYPLDVCLLPFITHTKYKENNRHRNWYFTFRWLVLFITVFHKYNSKPVHM